MGVEQQNNDKDRAQQLGNDAEKLLALAENLLERRERYDRKLFLSKIVGFAGAMGLTILAIFAFDYFHDSNLVLAVAIGTCGIIAAVSSFGFGLNNRSHDLYRREQRALDSVVDMLREIQPALAEVAGLSAIARAAFEIRLARFEIGPERADGNE